MGGHSAWRKRVARGEPMKGMGGAACRHHPHLGRKGKEQLALNRLGNIGGRPNPKNKKKKKIVMRGEEEEEEEGEEVRVLEIKTHSWMRREKGVVQGLLFGLLLLLVLVLLIGWMTIL